jgi:glycerol-3-phosphate acyltransferase PlsX
MKIGVDILGGDFAPLATVLGSIQVFNELDNQAELVLIGPEGKIKELCEKEGFDPSNFEIVHTDVQIEMGEHPVRSFSTKHNSSIVIGFSMLAKGQIDAFASAGNTGAMLVGATQVVKSIPGIIRPSIATTVPRMQESPSVLLDVGINPDCKPDVLYQYAILGSVYAEHVCRVENPKVGLLNIGEEEEKGNLLTKATFQTMKGTNEFNFIGNVEGNDFFSDKADVFVCDGFIGNLMLKEAEAFYKLVRTRGIKDDFFEKFNYENVGGTPVLGVNKPVIIGHGISNATAIKNMIKHAIQVVEADISSKFKEIFQP